LCFVVLVTALVIVMNDNVTFACLPCLLALLAFARLLVFR
jgi:hypothetical protein